jgi:hypothetical protein
MEQKDPRHLLVSIAKILKQLKIPYLVTGGIAVLIWGRPRFTADIDIVIELKPGDIDALEKALRALGKAGYIDKNSMRDALANQEEFNFIDGTTGIKIDFWISKKNDPLEQLRFKRKVGKTILGERIYFSSPEDLILSKLLWYQQNKSTRQLEDVESIIKISGKRLNKKYLKNWAKKLGVAKIFKKTGLN